MRHLIFGKNDKEPIDINQVLFFNGTAIPVTINGKITKAIDRNGSNTAIKFGSGNLISGSNLPASPVWSISFWAKTNQSAIGIILELTTNFNYKYAFLVDINELTNDKLSVASWGISYKAKTNNTFNFNDNNWHHWVIIFNRNETGDNEIKIYMDKVKLLLSTVLSLNSEQIGSYVSDKIYLGGRGNTYQYPFVGITSPFKLFNYPLTQIEIDNLYNE